MALQSMENEAVFSKEIGHKMKVGILTFHRALNYGAVLQCYALQKILESKTCDVEIIDYRQDWIEEFYKFFSPDIFLSQKTFSDRSGYIRNRVKKFLIAPHKRRNFRDFRNRYLKMSAPCGAKDIPGDYDLYLVGSDQLWSLHCLGGKPDDVFRGMFERAGGSHLAAYAVSADMKSVQAQSGDILSWAYNFDLLSMREKETAKAFASACSRECETCLDPTLLTDAEMWGPVVDEKWKNRRYVLMYEVRWNKESKGLMKRKARELADRIGDCELIDLSRGNYSVRDFVSLFKYAQCVVTSSFHAVVFSILFGTEFWALPLWDGYDLRYRELLESLGLGDRFAENGRNLEVSAIDWEPVTHKLTQLRASSLKYLDKCLSL